METLSKIFERPLSRFILIPRSNLVFSFIHEPAFHTEVIARSNHLDKMPYIIYIVLNTHVTLSDLQTINSSLELVHVLADYGNVECFQRIPFTNKFTHSKMKPLINGKVGGKVS